MCGSPRLRAGGMLLRSTSHVLHPLNHSPPYTRWRNVWLWSWLFTWPKRLPPFSERFWHTRPRSCTMTVLCIYFAPIAGYSRFTRNYCTHRPAAMLPHPNSGGRRLLTSFSDWIGGTCQADTLQVWFPAHWAPVVLQQLQKKEDKYRAEHPSWMDEEVAPVDIPKQWQKARANRRMQFKVGNYRDGSWESNIRLLTGTIKADWIQLPVEQYLAALPTLKQGVIAGVFRQKGAAPWRITNAEKLQLSVFLPNELSLEDWYAGVYGLPTVWPEVSMMGADHLRKVAGYDFHDLRRKYDVSGDIEPCSNPGKKKKVWC